MLQNDELQGCARQTVCFAGIRCSADSAAARHSFAGCASSGLWAAATSEAVRSEYAIGGQHSMSAKAARQRSGVGWRLLWWKAMCLHATCKNAIG